MHGVVYVRGQVTAMRGAENTTREILDQVSKVLRSRAGIRDVVIDAVVRD